VSGYKNKPVIQLNGANALRRTDFKFLNYLKSNDRR